jgi:hypothetical protein
VTSRPHGNVDRAQYRPDGLPIDAVNLARLGRNGEGKHKGVNDSVESSNVCDLMLWQTGREISCGDRTTGHASEQ